jgi:type IV secretory pathway VirB2 component (pilin)
VHTFYQKSQVEAGMSQFFNGSASKFLVAVMGAVLTGLGTYYGTSRWEPIVAAGLGAVMVFLVPNAPKPPADGQGKEPPARM